MHQVRATKLTVDGYKFDSKKEAAFYQRYVRTGGYRFECHPRFELQPMWESNGWRMRKVVYTPDFVIYNADGSIKHIYDVKNNFSSYGIDTAAKLRFKLLPYVCKTPPVEAVVMYAHCFKTKVLGTTKPFQICAHTDFDYDWWCDR